MVRCFLLSALLIFSMKSFSYAQNIIRVSDASKCVSNLTSKPPKSFDYTSNAYTFTFSNSCDQKIHVFIYFPEMNGVHFIHDVCGANENCQESVAIHYYKGSQATYCAQWFDYEFRQETRDGKCSSSGKSASTAAQPSPSAVQQGQSGGSSGSLMDLATTMAARSNEDYHAAARSSDRQSSMSNALTEAHRKIDDDRALRQNGDQSNSTQNASVNLRQSTTNKFGLDQNKGTSVIKNNLGPCIRTSHTAFGTQKGWSLYNKCSETIIIYEYRARKNIKTHLRPDYNGNIWINEELGGRLKSVCIEGYHKKCYGEHITELGPFE